MRQKTTCDVGNILSVFAHASWVGDRTAIHRSSTLGTSQKARRLRINCNSGNGHNDKELGENGSCFFKV